jgi:hypothetical protein
MEDLSLLGDPPTPPLSRQKKAAISSLTCYHNRHSRLAKLQLVLYNSSRLSKMAPDTQHIDGNAWQEYVDSLLSIHYSRLGHKYQRVPARAGGDAGLEGFSTCGNGYQAYADQESKDNLDRTRKQKRKITADLAKLKKNREFWETTLAGIKLHKWSLIVPHLDDREVVQHAREKGKELLAEKLPFVADDFQACVETPANFVEARANLAEPSLVCKIVRGEPVTEEQILGLAKRSPEFITKLEYKLSMTAPGTDITTARSDFLNRHLRCSNYLDDLEEKFPEYWETITELANATAAAIQTSQIFDTSPPAERLMRVRKEFEETLRRTAKFATEKDFVELSWGYVARWMGLCSLSFNEPKNA